MADVYGGPFAGVAITEIVSANAQTEINAQIDKIIALIPETPNSSGVGVQQGHPDFDQIPPHTAEKIRTELDALKTAIDAAPIA